jgi:tripartite-type tricarboxylate transporter receptor subunit TctC
VFVRRDVPDNVKAALVDVYAKAAEDATFLELMANRGNVVMNISGDEADAFLTKWQQVTVWALQDTGAAKVSPEDLGIPRP